MKQYFVWQGCVCWNARTRMYKDLKEALKDFDKAIELAEDELEGADYIVQLFEISSFQVDKIFYKYNRLNKTKWLKQKGHLLKEKVYKFADYKGE